MFEKKRNIYRQLQPNIKKMDQSDIKYTLELLNDAILEKNWDGVLEVKELLLEFLDSNESLIDE